MFLPLTGANHGMARQPLRDTFGKQRIAQGTYTPGEIDVPAWVEGIETDYARWRANRVGRVG